MPLSSKLNKHFSNPAVMRQAEKNAAPIAAPEVTEEQPVEQTVTCPKCGAEVPVPPEGAEAEAGEAAAAGAEDQAQY